MTFPAASSGATLAKGLSNVNLGSKDIFVAFIDSLIAVIVNGVAAVTSAWRFGAATDNLVVNGGTAVKKLASVLVEGFDLCTIN